MNKMKKRFIALLVVFTSIISFLPVGFSGQATIADTTTSDASTIHIYNGYNNTPSEITATTNSSSDEYYSCQYNVNRDGIFDIAVNNDEVTDLPAQAEAKMKTGSGSVSGVTDQKVEITSVNGITWTSETERDKTLNALGIYITSSSYPSIIGQRITGMPLGVNEIKYSITVTTTTYNYTAATSVTNADGTITTTPASTGNAVTSTKEYSNQKAAIYFGSQYVNSAISPMTIKAYTGDSKYFDANDNISDQTQLQNNASPFLYTTTNVAPDSDMSLKYTFDVPFSLTKLTYSMTFANSVYSDATIYKNGKLADVTVTNSSNSTLLSGSLGNLSGSGKDLILIRLGTTSADTIARTLCVELNYSTPDTNADYSINEAGITKGEYANDDNIKAYIGKKFTVAKDNTNTYNVYTGDLYINKAADTVSIDPTLIVDKDKAQDERTLAYVVTNQYYDQTSKTTKTMESLLRGGKRYVNFHVGSTNQIYVDVYKGENGTKTASSALLARYIFNVNLVDETNDLFSLDLAFDDNNTTDSTYLTQPGVKANQIDFSTSRRTYDLYSSDPVKVSFTGTLSQDNEYLKFWTASKTDSNSLTEATVTRNNKDYTVSLDGAEKMVVQAYYDQTTTTGASVSYSIGDNYIFYLPNNYTTTTSDNSTNAALNSLNITNGTFLDSSGNTTFSSSVLDYAVTVPKNDTTAKITAIAQDDNVKSIVATIEGSDTTYDLVSGEASELPLNTSGSTTVNIAVTAQDGTTIKKYTVVIKNNSKSSNVNLKNVILNTGDYTFNSTDDTTKVRVSQSTTSIKVTPVPEESNSTVTVDGTEYTGGTISVSLKGAQETDIEIVVKSEDGTESKTYTLQVYRTDSANWSDSSDSSVDSTQDDQYYDEYNECWVDTTKYEEWGTIGSKPAYFDKNNRQVKDAWISTGKKLYYLNSSGYRASGWKVDDADGKTYYLDPTTGEMRKGWMNLNNLWYYLGLNGVMHKGWLNLNQKWYYFTPNGQMVINQSMFIDDKVYNFGQDGAIY